MEFDKLLESIICLLLDVEAFCLQKVVKMLEKVVIGCWEVRWIWWMRQNSIAQFIQLLKYWLRGCCHGEESGPFCWPILAADVTDFSVYLIDLLSILLRCNGFSGIQKAVVDQTNSKPQKSDHDLFFGASLGLCKELWSFLLV